MYQYTATVSKVIDGDTVDLEIDLGFRIRFSQRVRLSGIDTPEKNSPDPEVRAKAMEAARYLEERLSAVKVVNIITEKSTKQDKQDKYGRYLAHIFIDGVSINQELITKNLAVPYE